MTRDDYIKKLEKRIHNQRVALRENWMIIEQRMNHRPTPLRSMWFELVKSQSREIRELKEKLKEDEKMQCPKCNMEMENKGNVDGVIYTSYPVQWDELYVCDNCKTKKSVRVHGHVEQKVDYSAYTEI